MEVDSMLRKVRSDVAQNTNNYQVPWTSSSLIGEFAFNQKTETTSPIVTSSPVPKPSPSIAVVPTPKPNPSPVLKPGTTLISRSTGVNYTNLRQLLQQKKWKEADEKTWDLMMAAANRQWGFDDESLRKFSCEDLRMIDQEWLNASGGKFGFSIQLAIYKQTGNTPGSFNEETYLRFRDAVGWQQQGMWGKRYEDLTWGTNAPAIAPKGHLPLGGGYGRLWEDQDVRRPAELSTRESFFAATRESFFAERLVDCRI